MAAVEENWQMKLSTIKERTTVIFNNELLSDVKFVVPVSETESESRKTIPAHKLVLAISSPVFYAMFYGNWRRLKTVLNCLTVSTTVCWSFFGTCTAMW